LLEFVGIVEIVGIVGICWTEVVRAEVVGAEVVGAEVVGAEVVGIFYKIKKICCKEAISNIIRIYLLAEKIPSG
jgi:hypothetical protein